MTRADLVEFLRQHRLAVQSSVSQGGSPQAAVVGIVVSDELEIVFDTLAGSRKATNLRRDPRVALVVGWSFDDARTAQIEGVADEPRGVELERIKALYFEGFPDGIERARTAEIAYFRVRPTWARLSDFRSEPPVIDELDVDTPCPSPAGNGVFSIP
jgi:hypothetical protein